MIEKELEIMIKKIIEVCELWIKVSDGHVYFEDPLEKKEISAHYGVSHASAAFIIYGEETDNLEIAIKGYSLLKSLLCRWDDIKKMQDFHNDFNNFALCVVEKYLKENQQGELLKKLKEIVLTTPDSCHQTVNWLPMRAYVNYCRFSWTKDEKYKKEALKCIEGIKKATFEDGFIDDRLPIGFSFNLQYDVATVAVMQFMKNINIDLDITQEINALLNVVSPDGDINYWGRGTNQIFAWGMWIYLLCSSGVSERERAVAYLKERLDIVLKKNNLMLNTWEGKERYLWWDYHYCSVYSAHLLLWLVLALRDNKKYLVSQKENYLLGKSGISIYKNSNFFVVTFDGRKEYLAEKGPLITNFWINGIGCIVKGAFGPWKGAFGNKYSNNEVIQNYFGLIEVDYNKDFSNNRILKRLGINVENECFIKKTPCFVPLEVKMDNNKIIFQWKCREEKERYLNIPVLSESKKVLDSLKIYVDDISIPCEVNSCLRNQYDWCWIATGKTNKGRKWSLEITI